MAVPGVSRPRVRDQPPQTRSWSSGHSGSSRWVMREAVGGEHAHPVGQRAMVLDVRHDAGLVVHLDVGRAVPVGLGGGQAGLVGVVGEGPARRVRDGEGEPAARPQHPRVLRDAGLEVGDELQGAEAREHDVERRVGEGQRGGGAQHAGHRHPGRLVEATGVLELAPREVEPDRPAALREHPARALPGTAADLEDLLAGDGAEHAGLVLGEALGSPDEADVAEELAVGGLVLVGVAVPVGPVGPPGLALVDRSPFHPDRALRPRVLHTAT